MNRLIVTSLVFASLTAHADDTLDVREWLAANRVRVVVIEDLRQERVQPRERLHCLNARESLVDGMPQRSGWSNPV